jgi:DNA mismatch repair protein MutS
VARLAGMPQAVLNHARHALSSLESQADAQREQVDLFAPPPMSEQAEPSLLEARMAQIDPDALTPREALDALYALKKLQQN